MSNTTENNKLIAEFMGGKYQPRTDSKLESVTVDVWEHHKEKTIDEIYKLGNYTYLMENVIFNSSWDWLMPVVEKIEVLEVGNNKDLKDIFVILKKGTCKIYVQTNSTLDKFYYEEYYFKGSLIENTYKAVVQFIKWYNENK